MADENNTQVAGATGSTITEPSADAGQPSIADIMGFDPFAPGADGKMTVVEPKPAEKPADTKPAEVKPAEVKPAVEPKLDAAGKPIPEPVAPQAAMPAVLDTKPLEQLIREQTATIQQSLTRAEPAKKDEPKPPRFTLGVPEQLVGALNSDDPKERGLALNAVVSGVANHVWDAMQTHLQEQLAQLVEGIPRVISAHSSYAKETERVSTDFFGKYEMFKGEAFGPILQDAALKVAQAWQGAGKPISWNEEFRDAVAENMFTRFPMLRAAAPAAPAADTKRVPFATGGGARQPAPAVNEFEAVLAST
jgi:hypothetical protein